MRRAVTDRLTCHGHSWKWYRGDWGDRHCRFGKGGPHPIPVSLQEVARENGFPGHYRSFLILCRQLALSGFTYMALFCLKWLHTSAQGQPVLQAVTVPTGGTPYLQVKKKETSSCPGRAHKDCLSINCCTTLQGLQAFVPIALVCYSLACHHAIFFFPSQRKISKAAGTCNPGDISEEITV